MRDAGNEREGGGGDLYPREIVNNVALDTVINKGLKINMADEGWGIEDISFQPNTSPTALQHNSNEINHPIPSPAPPLKTP